jgi:hypothetical protein
MRVILCRLCAVAAALAAASAAPAAPVPENGAKSDNAIETARKALDEVGDLDYQNRSLNDVIADLKTKLRVPVTIDTAVYNFGLDPTQPSVTVHVKQAKLRDGLRAALAPFNLKFGLTRDGLFISSEEGVTNRQLRQRVSVDCDANEFAATVKQLAAGTGANVVLDPRLGEKAKTPVTLKLEDVPLESAVRLLAEVADLRAVRMSNVLFVTTPERAKELRPDADEPTKPMPVNPFFPGQDGLVMPGGFGGIGGIQAFPINPPPLPAPAPVEQVEPAPEAPAPATPQDAPATAPAPASAPATGTPPAPPADPR